METVGGKKLGIGLVKWMVRIRKSMEERGGEVGWDVSSRFAAANVDIICFFPPVFPIPDLGL